MVGSPADQSNPANVPTRESKGGANAAKGQTDEGIHTPA